jgi:proteasome lid subunit RPN8/RPN11
MAVIALYLPNEFARRIESEGAKAYPNECCGILVGTEKNGRREVDDLWPVDNSFEQGEQFHRFSITPKVLMQAERKVAAAGKLVLGFYHSHPDHPARPSEYDREHAWPFYSYIIVSIAKGEPVDMTSWVLEESTSVFSRQDIIEF